LGDFGLSDPIKFDRKPYKVSYIDQNGIQQTIRRVPPPKLHAALPGDKVDITTTKSDDFRKGDTFSVKHINPRHPNVIQIQASDGRTTFLNFNEFKLNGVELEERDGGSGTKVLERSQTSKYLLWP